MEYDSSASLYMAASFVLIKTHSFYQAYFHKPPDDSGCPQLRTINIVIKKRKRKKRNGGGGHFLTLRMAVL